MWFIYHDYLNSDREEKIYTEQKYTKTMCYLLSLFCHWTVVHLSDDSRKIVYLLLFDNFLFCYCAVDVSVFYSVRSILYHTLANHNSVILFSKRQNVSNKWSFEIETINYRLELIPKCIILNDTSPFDIIDKISCILVCIYYLILCCGS